MIVSTGWGSVAVIIWGICLGLTQLLVDTVMQQSGYYTANVWPKLVGNVISAPTIWFAGRQMNGPPHSDRRRHGARHTLCWIPMEYWAFIFTALGVIVAMVPELEK